MPRLSSNDWGATPVLNKYIYSNVAKLLSMLSKSVGSPISLHHTPIQIRRAYVIFQRQNFNKNLRFHSFIYSAFLFLPGTQPGPDCRTLLDPLVLVRSHSCSFGEGYFFRVDFNYNHMQPFMSTSNSNKYRFCPRAVTHYWECFE